MSGFGDQLRDAREARGLALDEVAAATRISVRHLEALERGDVEALPAGPFARGYIEACAKHLGVDAGLILEAYRAEGRRRGLDVAETRDRVFEEYSQIVGGRGPTSPRAGRLPGGRSALALLLVAIGLGLGGWLVMRDRAADDPTATSSSTAPPQLEEAAVRPGALPSAEPPRTSASGPPQARATEASREASSLPEGGVGTAPPPAPEATPDISAARANPNIQIPDSGIGTGVESRRLVGGGDRFPEGSEVVFWTRVVGGEPGNVIEHVWLHEGRGIARIRLAIGSSHWRTHSRRPLPPGAAGSWVAEARDVDGRLLARQEFVCFP